MQFQQFSRRRKFSRLKIAMLVGLLVAGTAATANAAVTGAASGLSVSGNINRSGAVDLNSKKLGGTVYVFPQSAVGLTSVSYTLDLGLPSSVTVPVAKAPFSLTVNTAALTSGTHTLNATTKNTDGSTKNLTASFQTGGAKKPATSSTAAGTATGDLTDPAKKEIAMQLVSASENSSLAWKEQYSYIEDIGDGRGFTGGIIGFCSGTGDMVEMLKYYEQIAPGNSLAKFIAPMEKLDGSDSHAGIEDLPTAWKAAAKDVKFQQAQDHERDRVYFDPSVALAKQDKVQALGQFAYYDAAVMHGFDGMEKVRKAAMAKAKPPAQGGDETAYLNAFMDARVAEMKTEAAHDDTSRVDTTQRKFLQAKNLTLALPLSFAMYGEPFTISK